MIPTSPKALTDLEQLTVRVRDLETALAHARQVAELERRARLAAEERERIAWRVAARI